MAVLQIWHLYTATYRDQQRFTIRSGVLIGNDTRWHSAISGSPYPNERTLDPTVCSYNRPTYTPASHTMAFSPQCCPAM